ncbi:MAG: ABC transporter permease [Hyphomicrobiales bacterium]|uniref:ABC transporter permease n=1 Tax=Rhabdaerophilum calidifontis TaxID=2604328 RepID=UPI00123AEC8C|nr:ABC transporter permease [Rhabdaerophilum calidifontis]MCA1952837.1 ABC transporter permease [Hyphomicrobiales bacterium]
MPHPTSEEGKGLVGGGHGGRVARLIDSDILLSLRASGLTMVAAVIVVAMFLGAAFAPLIAPFDPFDPAKIFLSDASIPPRWQEGGDPRFLFGTDDQGRDLYSAILYGLRVSLVVGGLGVLLAAAIGITLGLVAGYLGGRVDAIIMRIADVQLTFPAILIALLIDGVVQALLRGHAREETAVPVLVISIGLSFWVQYARTIRGSTLVEKSKDYVAAARLVGLPAPVIMIRHVLPNVIGPVLVILTINLGLAIITEATLSFLGVGLPPTQPSLGTLISIGNKYLFSGDWWIVAFPGATLAILVLAVNLLGDWLRDALNPKLR